MRARSPRWPYTRPLREVEEYALVVFGALLFALICNLCQGCASRAASIKAAQEAVVTCADDPEIVALDAHYGLDMTLACREYKSLALCYEGNPEARELELKYAQAYDAAGVRCADRSNTAEPDAGS